MSFWFLFQVRHACKEFLAPLASSRTKHEIDSQLSLMKSVTSFVFKKATTVVVSFYESVDENNYRKFVQ